MILKKRRLDQSLDHNTGVLSEVRNIIEWKAIVWFVFMDFDDTVPMCPTDYATI